MADGSVRGGANCRGGGPAQTARDARYRGREPGGWGGHDWVCCSRHSVQDKKGQEQLQVIHMNNKMITSYL